MQQCRHATGILCVRMNREAETTLHRLLHFVGEAARSARELGQDDIRVGARGYVGGTLATLRDFGHITEAEEAEWGNRLLEALGDDPDAVLPLPE